jgi:hypothetical protein
MMALASERLGVAGWRHRKSGGSPRLAWHSEQRQAAMSYAVIQNNLDQFNPRCSITGTSASLRIAEHFAGWWKPH